MATYVWNGKTVGGVAQSGELTFDTQDEVLSYLRKRKITITSIKVNP